jgi:hydroxyethylthiazole kinase-like uncharacterized protein yjeF
MRVVGNDEMRLIDDEAIDRVGIPSLVLMENAGLEAARLISQRCRDLKYDGEVLVFCGKGKNGGDGLVVARRLLSSGHRVRIFLLHEQSHYAAESSANLTILKNQRARISVIESARFLEEYFSSAAPPYIAVDAMLGTGLKRNVEGLYFDVIEILNNNATEIISLDVPSGVNGDTGAIHGTSVLASATISFGYPKIGLFLAPGAARRGALYHVDLCFPKEWGAMGDKALLTKANTAGLLQDRDRFGHKNSFGHCLLVGGSPGRVGAIDMASRSCLKMGTGLVTVASWEESFPALEIKLASEVMNFRLSRDGDTFVAPKPGISGFSAIVVGPGLGMRPEGAQLLKQLLVQYQGPLVIDADGLNLISDFKLYDYLTKRKHPTVLTPHPGEMARLLQKEKSAVVDNPVAAVREAVERTGAVVLLKGATTLIHSVEGVTWLNHYPNDGMATAGSGDVLAGIIGGLVGQKMHPTTATKLGVYLHSLAGKIAAQTQGHRAMTALDLVESLGRAFAELKIYKEQRFSSACEEIL